MKQPDLYRSVARATGESVRRLRRIGFRLVVPPPSQAPAVWPLTSGREALTARPAAR